MHALVCKPLTLDQSCASYLQLIVLRKTQQVATLHRQQIVKGGLAYADHTAAFHEGIPEVIAEAGVSDNCNIKLVLV